MNEDEVLNTAAEIVTVKHLQYWAEHKSQALLNEVN